jgi:hypothetical protein
MLIAQSMTDGLTVLTHDRAFAPYGRSSAQPALRAKARLRDRVGADPGTSPGCGVGGEGLALRARVTPPAHDLARGLETGYFERMGYSIGGWLPPNVR